MKSKDRMEEIDITPEQLRTKYGEEFIAEEKSNKMTEKIQEELWKQDEGRKLLEEHNEKMSKMYITSNGP